MPRRNNGYSIMVVLGIMVVVVIGIAIVAKTWKGPQFPETEKPQIDRKKFPEPSIELVDSDEDEFPVELEDPIILVDEAD